MIFYALVLRVGRGRSVDPCGVKGGRRNGGGFVVLKRSLRLLGGVGEAGARRK